jgi:hypothetical protein
MKFVLVMNFCDFDGGFFGVSGNPPGAAAPRSLFN